MKDYEAVSCIANMIVKIKGFDDEAYDDYFTYSAKYNKFNQIIVEIDN